MTLETNRRRASAMAEAANDLLASLDAEQRACVAWSFDDAERKLWFYTPTNHGGLTFAEMSGGQQRGVWRLLASGLSAGGYNTAAAIVSLENVLDRVEGFGVDFDRDRGRDPQLYWIAIFGTPGERGSWGWRFGGHHVSLHFTVAEGRVVGATPCFLGADPSSSPLLGPHLHRPLAAVEDLGRELVLSLDDEQRAAAVLAPAPPPDLVGVNRAALSEGDRPLDLIHLWRERFDASVEGFLDQWQQRLDESIGVTEADLAALAFTRRPKGVAASALRGDQRQVLRALLETYVGRIHDDLADDQLALLDADFDQLHFVWAGDTAVGRPHYYRVQGGDLLVEYDHAQRDGNHVHTVWRDLRHDFGGDPLAEHYLGAPAEHGHD